MKTPRVTVRPASDGAIGERIVEITFCDGTGCLMSVASNRLMGGDIAKNVVELYRTDPGIVVIAPGVKTGETT